MGLLISGTPLSWEETQQQADYVRKQGIEQFLHIWKEAKKKKKKQLLWGDEIEYMLISYDDKNKIASLSLQQDNILKSIENYKEANKDSEFLDDRKTKYDIFPSFHSEYGNYMIEGIPGIPYGEEIEALLDIEENMKNRRVIIKKYIKPNEIILTLTSFPRLGAPGVFTDPYHPPKGRISCSLFLPDEIISPHIRFLTLTKNIRLRRGKKVVINVPIFIDENTPLPFIDEAASLLNTTCPESVESLHEIIKPNHIYMDSMCFGMGCCCLQVTFQTTDISQAKILYDQLIPMGPIMLSLTAASPAYKGYLSDQDCRWNVISRCVDDRTAEEMGEEPLKNHKFVISKSRYDSVDCYIANDTKNHPKYNDTKLIVDEEIKEKLISNGVDELLANHISHLFIRDPLIIFSNMLIQNKEESGHFENIQSTNWQALRFKPPPPGTDIGWRVEFRTMEIQLSDFENAAYSIFINLLTRIILFYDLNFYIPISKVDENMNTAHHRSSVLTEKFWFRKNIFSVNSCFVKQKSSLKNEQLNKTSKNITMLQVNDEYDEYEKMTIHEIINGQGNIHNGFPGLIPLIQDYFDSINLSQKIRQVLEKYLELIKKRASGEWQTTASWIRSFVRNHPAYRKDSVISQEINYDLIKKAEKISNEFGKNQKLTNYFLGIT
ncbi:hypothetical protein PNEG_01286 [Pneumocystis murina B123]|uniref:Glutamate--cysteine ligase n=1 Tax=Pneumocystis murina (strain B123) TaxID=1069680 RepID=M7NTY7_PNEMU|nr:hypothetical protein PNEG_01286 [Pneumocystis murina B123]EMR10581.1 hypothetical protein PNEG_01286 [Pneumocystis murina B123]